MSISDMSHDQWMTFWIVVTSIIGLAVGSFLNVVIWRIPNKISLFSPGSQCPRCKKEILWYDNIPIVSYIALLGKCRNCKARISSRYPLVEILTAAVWGITTWRIGIYLYLPGYLLFFAGLIALSAIDIDTKLLPKKIVYASGIMLYIFLVIDSVHKGQYNSLRDSLIVGACYCAFLFIIWFASNGKAMGFGDVRLAAFLGASMGYFGLIISYLGMLFSFALGSVIGIAIATISGSGRKMKIPFGPFLAAGTIVAIWMVPAIREWVVLDV